MYEFSREIAIFDGSSSNSSNNLTVFHYETKNMTFAATVHKHQVNIVHWELNSGGLISDHIRIKDPSSERPFVVIQAKFCLVSNRNFPLLAVASTGGAMVFDSNNGRMLAWTPLLKDDGHSVRFVRGISFTGNLIIMGTHTGDILQFVCSGENSVKPKTAIKEHLTPIVDIATSHFDDQLTCTCDVTGNLIVWTKNMKNASNKIATSLTINCLNILQKYAICGTISGQLFFYSTQTGDLMAQVNAHVRPVSAIAVAPESALILTAGEDSFIRIFKLHTRKPESFKVEWCHSEAIAHSQLVGAQFNNKKGSAFLLSAYDCAKLFQYQISKKYKLQLFDI